MSLDLRREALEATFSELSHLLIKPARLTVEEEEAELGAGGFGEVYLATLDKSSTSRRKVAVKQLRMVEASVRLARELKVWAKVRHPNILELIGYHANVLINASLDAVLCDFGVSSFIRESGAASGLTTSKSIKGSLLYMAPELNLEDEPKHTLQSDVWAWGCTAFEVGGAWESKAVGKWG
ncbi:hypothetical protein FRC00_005928 [Tulasnella sp. 408]|nr:hypothetical protein FRC00_005928 [Tulasnella sp. 408]